MKALTLHMAAHESTDPDPAARVVSAAPHGDLKSKQKAEEQLARGKKKIHFSYEDFGLH